MKYTTDNFHYDKTRKVMTGEASMLGVVRFPERITITSTHTNTTIEFVQDREAAIANEFWDGELVEYIPVPGTVVNVKKVVIFNT